ncbi:VOC family protein [Microlunatus sp. GCM10028923]|uniref:VOC family protein n=1 Tax=Microlunatus sp. GCM10028923 TaxID=3273400 RepID=UPI003608B558
MTAYELDHVTLGVSHLYDGAERLRRATGLRSAEGGWLTGMPTAHRVVPLPGGAYINVESVIARPAELDPGVRMFAGWFEDVTAAGDHWMTWNLRVRSRAELQAVADRLGGEVVTAPGANRPDGTTTTTVMAPGNAAMTWARGLPNFYLRDDQAAQPRVEHERPVTKIAWLEIGADRAELVDHVGAETFEFLSLRLVDGPAGLRAIGLTAADGDEIVIRADSAAPALAEIARRVA